MAPPAMALQVLTLAPLPLHLRTARRRVRVLAVAADQTPPPLASRPEPANSPSRLLRELAERKKAVSPKKKHPPRRFILKPPLDDERLTQRFLNSPQLSLKSLPLLSSCLPSAPLSAADRTWMDEYILEAKQALGYPLAPSETLGDGDDCPARHFDVLLYLAFQHLDPSCERTRTRHVRNGHSRLWFLGQFVLELAFCEFFLQRYPRESPGPMRERVFALIGKKVLPKWIKAASLHNLVFPYDDLDKMIRKDREPPAKAVFWALFGAIYLCFGMPEVYRVLFEAFGMDPEDESCQPKLRRQLEDVDYVSVEFEKRQIMWQDVAAYRPPPDALFAYPRLFRACVPPGMHRFGGNIWDFDNRPKVMNTLGYPLPMNDRIPEITEARNIELGLGLQKLKEKAAFKNPDEFYFKMINSRTVDGIHRPKPEANKYSEEELMLLKNKDMGYILQSIQSEKKKIERLSSMLHELDNKPSNKHVYFAQDREEAKEIQSRIEQSSNSPGFGNIPSRIKRKTASSYKELEERKQRVQKLEKLYADMALQKELKKPGRKRKLREDEITNPTSQPVYKWRAQRKR